MQKKLSNPQMRVLDLARDCAVRDASKETVKEKTRLQGAALDAVLVSLEGRGYVDQRGAATDEGRKALLASYEAVTDESDAASAAEAAAA